MACTTKSQPNHTHTWIGNTSYIKCHLTWDIYIKYPQTFEIFVKSPYKGSVHENVQVSGDIPPLGEDHGLDGDSEDANICLQRQLKLIIAINHQIIVKFN